MSAASTWKTNYTNLMATRPILNDSDGKPLCTVTFDGNLEFLRPVIKPTEIQSVATWVQNNFLT